MFFPEALMLEICEKSEYNGGYGNVSTLEPVCCRDLSPVLLAYAEGGVDFADQVQFVIRAMVRRRTWLHPWRRPRFLAPLDVDSPNAMYVARAFLAEEGIASCAITTSPGHYWLLPDASFATSKEAVNLVASTPGVCRDYVRIVKRRKQALVRAFPKGNGHLPVFGDDVVLGDRWAAEWLRLLRAHFGSPEVRKLSRILAVARDGVDAVAADPSFF